MKRLLLLLTLFTLHTGIFQAAVNNLQALVITYGELTDALVDSNSKMAAEKARKFASILGAIPLAGLSKPEGHVLKKNKEKMLELAGSIAKSADVEVQRKSYAQLSEIMWTLVKASGSIAGPLYYQYCPMKKWYWISNTAAIRNPFYGIKMLTCGSTSDTLK
ncbi:MAG: DUF3347 domain-containing protein [Bacteroidia bacterium]|nr:DUF3347 domain-containing protein [Bacteroidia bacterium]